MKMKLVQYFIAFAAVLIGGVAMASETSLHDAVAAKAKTRKKKQERSAQRGCGVFRSAAVVSDKQGKEYFFFQFLFFLLTRSF